MLAGVQGGDRVKRRTFDGIPAGHQVIQQDADTVDVAGDRCGMAGKQLGSQIQRRPDHSRVTQCIFGSSLAGAEVHQHDAAAGLAHDVLRLDIAMKDASFVDRRHGAADIDADERSLVTAEQSSCSKQSSQRQTLDPLHPQAEGSLVFIDSVHRDHVRVAHAGEQAAFLDHGL